MRLRLIFNSKERELILPADYRRLFMSFIKKAFTVSNYAHKIYRGRVFRPFCFSVFLGEGLIFNKSNSNSFFRIKLPIDMIFSTGDTEVFINFYNGCIKLLKQKEGILLRNGENLFLDEIEVKDRVKIRSRVCLFKTIGISVLTDPEENAKDFKKWFLTPVNSNLERFNFALEKRTFSRYKFTTGVDLLGGIIFTPLSEDEIKILIRQGLLNSRFGTKSIKEIVIYHYGGFLKGFKGVFWIESYPEILQFIYDFGLGVKTGQGFGCVELIKQL